LITWLSSDARHEGAGSMVDWVIVDRFDKSTIDNSQSTMPMFGDDDRRRSGVDFGLDSDDFIHP
jgi:hypothetical protein